MRPIFLDTRIIARLLSCLGVGLCLLGCNKIKEKDSQFMVAPEGDVASVVKSAKASLKGNRKLLVYVSADWCGPCKVFQDGVQQGKLNTNMSDFVFLKFDSDTDETRLEAANYGGRMIPRFVKPNDDGQGSDQRFEGSIEGPDAFMNIVTQLQNWVD